MKTLLSGLALAGLLAAALPGLGSHWGWWDFCTGFTILRWAAYSWAAVLLSILRFLWNRPESRSLGLAVALAGEER